MTYKEITKKVLDSLNINPSDDKKLSEHDSIALAMVVRILYFEMVDLFMMLEDEVFWQPDDLPQGSIIIHIPVCDEAKKEYEKIDRYTDRLQKYLVKALGEIKARNVEYYNRLRAAYKDSIRNEYTSIINNIKSCVYKKNSTIDGSGLYIDDFETTPSRTVFKLTHVCEEIIDVLIRKCDDSYKENVFMLFDFPAFSERKRWC